MEFSTAQHILKGLYSDIGKDHLTIVSAGMAYYLILSIFPALAALVLLFGIIADPVSTREQIENMGAFLPSEVQEVIVSQIDAISQRSGQAGLGATISILIAFWSGSKASRALVQALNIVYRERETRGFFRVAIIGYGMTICGVIIGILSIGLIVIIPPLLQFLNLRMGTELLIEISRWLVLVGLFMTVLSLLFRFAPDRKPPRWKWVTPGAVIATLVWIAASFVFSWYVSNFGHYSETYGSLGAAIIFMLWLYISSFLVLLGAELNKQIETHIKKGPPHPDSSNHQFPQS